ncbi:MAG: immune inhibitor A domain-containing protein [Micromonosporaceae bacterium]
MRRLTKVIVAGLSAGVLAAGGISTHALGTTPSDDAPPPARAHAPDDLPNPLADKQREMKKAAIAKALRGGKTERRGDSEVMRLGKDEYVEMELAKEDPVFTVLTDFGDKTDPRTGGTAGPGHNQIPRPDRDWNGDATDNNSDYWVSDFSRAHFMKLFYGKRDSFRDFYLKQSGGKYTIKGDVSPWVTVPYNEARYGSNEIPGADGYWNYVKDTAKAWYESQVAAGKTPEEIKQYLTQFDLWDRYDHDGDGNFDEADGYIDHFQAVHAGVGEEAGGGSQGGDAIWSHRWYAFSNNIGREGPDFNKLGGVPLGDSGMWIGDYTTEPENGGLGVFAHEYGHDLGLPDLYDTAGGDNGTGFWSIMSGGSWLNKGFDSIGTKPGYMGAWEKLVLGWLDYEVVPYQGEAVKVKLGRAGQPGDEYGAVVVTLPKQKITTEYNKPHSGQYEWWGGSADNLNTTLARDLDLTGATTSAALNAKAWYEIEEGYDYLYAEVSADGGNTWEAVGQPVDGTSNGQWTDVSYDLSAYKGTSVKFRYRYQSDGGVHLAGAFLDDLSLVVDGAAAWSDDVEAGEGSWAATGFTRMTGSKTEEKEHYYLAENRQYVGYDDTLRTGPYNFGWANTKPDWVERFPNQNGLLVWYVNYAYEDNNTKTHPGYGNVLPVDARPAPVVFSDGVKLGNRRQSFDATFGIEATDAVTFHRNGVPVEVPSSPGIRTFDDSDPDRYWSAANPWNSCKVAGAGVKITVLSGTTGTMTVKISFA